MEEKHHFLYPGDLLLPAQSFGGEKDLLDIVQFMDTPYVGTT